MKRIAIVILWLTGTAAALGVGETGLNHLRIQPDARSQGMGGVSLGLASNPQAFFANPAALPAEGMVLAANYLPYPAGIHIGSVSFQPSGSSALRLSGAAFYLNSGQMKLTSPTNEELGTFSYHVLNLGATAAYPVAEHASIGINLKAHLAAADSNVQVAVAADAGVMLEDLITGLALGVVVENAAFEIDPFVEERSPMPLGVGGGASYSGVKNLLVGLDVLKPLDAPLVVRGGVEFLPVEFLALRGGYSTQGTAWKTGEGSDILAGFSLGLGVRDLAGISVDYAVTPGLALGLFHRISITYRFP